MRKWNGAVADCIKEEDGSVCGWYGICFKKKVRMCEIKGKNQRDTQKKRLEFVKSALSFTQKKVINAILSNK